MLINITNAIGVETMTITIVAITLVLFVLDRLPIALTAMLSSIALAIFGCMDYKKVYAGFSSTVVMLVFGMMIIGYALFETGVVILIGRKIIKSRFAKNERTLLILLMLVVGVTSAFLSNTATVATFIPLVGAIVASSDGKLTNKNILMGIGMAASVGGTITLVGSTSQPMVNSILEEYGYNTIGMFDFVWVAIPLFIVLIVYMATIGYKIQNKVFTFKDLETEIAIGDLDEFKPTKKTYIAAGTMIFCIICFVFKVWSIAFTALFGASIVLLTGCINFKDTMRNIDWNTILLMAFAQGIAAGMNDSGAGKMIADATVNLVGDNLWLLFAICVVITVVLTNIMSNTAVAAMMTPIYLVIAVSVGVNPFVFAMGIAVASNASIATPIGGTAMSQVLVAGYRFRDYLKVGVPITIVLTIMTIIITPLVFGFLPL